MKIERNKLLRNLTTFHIGGRAKYYAEVTGRSDILSVNKFAKKNDLKIFILGGGSNILVSDNGFDGIVIKHIGRKIKPGGKDMVAAEAGVIWDDLVAFTVDNGLQGIECLSGIPGTVGASPVQNIGAYGQEVKNTFFSLCAYDFEKETFVEFNNKDCQFGYRESVFKKPENRQRYLIISATFKLNKNAKPHITYESLANYLSGRDIKSLTLKDVREAVLALRKEKLESPDEIGNAGSFFKNPIVENNIPGVPSYPFGNKRKLYAGWLIEKAGWKGKSYRGAAVSAKNALILLNKSGKSASKDIEELSGKIIKSVKRKFGIILEPEVQFIGTERNIAILGYGLEGKDAEKYFKSLGENVTILDITLDENYLSDLKSFDIIVRSPGVYRYLSEIVKAEEKGVEITSAVKIFFDMCPAKIIGVTGTKGKGTTSTLIYEILKKEGKDVYLAGNIGKSYLELLPKLTKNSFVILELSSFQLIDLTKSPHIAVVLNITLDHMDWHKNAEEYVEAKENIVAHQTAKDFAVINKDYSASAVFAKYTKGKVVYFSRKTLEDKYKKDLLLRGEHNLENIAAAVAVARILNISDDKIKRTISSFKGLEHRLELVGSINGVSFYNDSFATGPQPTIAAIKSFSEPVTIILGGSEKGLDYEQLGREIAKTENVKKTIIIGETGSKIIAALKKAKYRRAIINLRTSSMRKIVENAYRNTLPGGVVLLSPAAASFDMFKSYKDRGNQFRVAVSGLKNGH